MSVKSQRMKKRESLRNQILQRKERDIELLKEKIVELQNECNKKDEFIKSIEDMRNELKKSIDDINKRKEEYRSLNEDLRQMKNVFNKTIFKGRWRIIKWLMK